MPGLAADGVAFAAIAAFAASVSWIAGCGAARDIIPETRDVRGPTTEAAPDAGADDYSHVARRPHGVVALAEARGMSGAAARIAVDRLADDLESCAERLQNEGKLVEGAARVVARVTDQGAVDGLNVKLAPGGAVAANALLCVIAPLKALVFPSADAGARGLAIEVTWGGM